MTRTRTPIVHALCILGMLAGVIAAMPALAVTCGVIMLSHDLRNVQEALPKPRQTAPVGPTGAPLKP